MGWTADNELNHVNNIVNDALRVVKATDCELVPQSIKSIISGCSADPGRVWYLADNDQGQTYVGLIRLDIDRESTELLRPDARPIYDWANDRLYPSDDPHIAVWAWSYQALADGPKYQDYSERFREHATVQ